MVAEVAPFLVPQFDALLLALLVLCGFIVAAGLVYVLHAFVRATVGGIAGLLGKIPGVGFIIASPVNSVYHWMNKEFGAAEAGLDRRISSYWHQLAKLVSWVGDEIAAHASLLWTLSTVVLGSAITAELRLLINLARKELHALEHRVGSLTSSIVRPIQGELRALERWTYPRVKAAEHAIDVTIPRDVAGLRARTKAIEGSLADLWEAIRANDAALAATAFAGAVAIALSRLGLGWLRCPALSRIGNKIGCGGFRLLEGLLAGAIEVLIIADLCQITKLMIEVAESAPVQDALSGFVAGIDELLLCQGVTRPPALPVRTVALPPQQTWALLAA